MREVLNAQKHLKTKWINKITLISDLGAYEGL